jgi:hypothetical protein
MRAHGTLEVDCGRARLELAVCVLVALLNLRELPPRHGAAVQQLGVATSAEGLAPYVLLERLGRGHVGGYRRDLCDWRRLALVGAANARATLARGQTATARRTVGDMGLGPRHARGSFDYGRIRGDG